MHAQTKPIEPANMDTTVKPCDDFFRYVNGNWLKKNPIPAAYNQWGSFTILQENNGEVLHAILEDAKNDAAAPGGSNKRKIGDFYASGMDSAAIEALGWKPIAEDLQRVDAVKDEAGLKTAITYLYSKTYPILFGFGSEQDPKNSVEVIGELHQAGL